ncbi:MAG: hypothetical protein WDZ49_02470 [Litorilinea sp.]
MSNRQIGPATVQHFGNRLRLGIEMMDIKTKANPKTDLARILTDVIAQYSAKN